MISGGYKSAAYKMPARVVASGSVFRQTYARPNMTRPSLAEMKFKDTTASSTITVNAATFTTPGATFLLNGLVPDSTATGRIGRRVTIKSLYVRLTFGLLPASTGGSPLRVVIVYDKQSNAAAPAVTDIMAADSFQSPNNISNRDRFITLCDRVTDPIGAAGEFQVALNFYKKLNLGVQFNAGTAGTIADITSGAIYILFAQAAGITTTAPICTWYSRIRYNDQ